MEKWVRSRI